MAHGSSLHDNLESMNKDGLCDQKSKLIQGIHAGVIGFRIRVNGNV